MPLGDELRERVQQLRAEADRLEAIASALEKPIFDPERDTPPVVPKPEGTRDEQNWCGLILWGRLHALRIRSGTGASPRESREIAQAAGYMDARGWNAWTLGCEKDPEGNRHITPDGLVHLRNYLRDTGRSLPADLWIGEN